MSAISELLTSTPDEFVQKMLPKGDYLCQIIKAEILHGYWKGNAEKGTQARWFECYVPTIQIVDYVESGDEDIDAATLKVLETFGDWKGYKPPKNFGRWVQAQTIPNYDQKIVCAGIANGLNFPLVEATPDWQAKIEMAPAATRFFTSRNSHGESDGFVVKVLSTDPEIFTPPEIASDTGIGAVIEATNGCYLVVSLDDESDPNGVYEPKTICTGTSNI